MNVKAWLGKTVMSSTRSSSSSKHWSLRCNKMMDWGISRNAIVSFVLSRPRSQRENYLDWDSKVEVEVEVQSKVEFRDFGIKV